MWAQELQGAIRKITSVLEKLAEEKGEDADQTKEKMQGIVHALRLALRNVWAGDESVFEVMWAPNQSIGSSI
jgi:hypothetical protein